MRGVCLVLVLLLPACGGEIVRASGTSDAEVDAEAIDGASSEDVFTKLDAPSEDSSTPLAADVPAPRDRVAEDLVSQGDRVAPRDVAPQRDAPDVVAEAPRCDVNDIGSALGDAVARGTTLNAANRHRGACGGAAGPEVVLRWTAPRAGTYTFTTAGSDFDTLIYLRSECGGPDRVCNDDVVSGVVRSSTMTQTLMAGEPVLIFIDGWEDSAGSYVLNIAEGGPVRCTAGRTRSCYGGPEGTRDVGRCRAVTQTCLSQGVWPDLCRGDTRPNEVEVCGNRVDDDCDGVTDEGCEAMNTRAFEGVLTYERRVPNSARSDWTAAPDAPAPGFAVFSFRGDQMIDASTTSTEAMRLGRFTIRVPTAPAADDRVVVAALHRTDAGLIDYALGDPALMTGTHAAHAASDNARVWSWSWRTEALPSGDTLRITRAMGSGAAVTFEHLARAVRSAQTRYARPGRSLIAWQGDGVAWSCGACFSVTSTQRFAQGFSSQISMFGDTENQAYWSPSTITHEVGHWVMASFGVSPREGGTHYLNTPESPGLAWSEGYATWFGAALRDDPVIVSKQRGFMYWFDIDARRLSSNRAWARPSAAAALDQPIAENEVSADLWDLARSPRDPLHAALVSDRMTRAPFLRGYRNPQRANVPYFADYLDALRCAGFDSSVVRAAIGPYPYDPSRPLCRASNDEAPPLEVSWREERLPDGAGTVGAQGDRRRLTARVVEGATLDAAVAMRFVPPAGVRVEGGQPVFTLPSLRPGRVSEHAFVLRGAITSTSEARLAAEVVTEGFGLRGASVYRFGRGETPAPARALGAPLRLRGVSLGPSVLSDR